MEVGWLFQGFDNKNDTKVEGTNTCKFIGITKLPKDRKATYVRVVTADRPRKEETKRARMTVGGDQIDYPGEVSTKTADILTTKILLNKVISTPGAKFMGMDLKDFYLSNNLPRPEYIRIPMAILPQEIIDYYNLEDIAVNGFEYTMVLKGMYGLHQAGRVASDALVPRLKAAGTRAWESHQDYSNTPRIQYCSASLSTTSDLYTSTRKMLFT